MSEKPIFVTEPFLPPLDEFVPYLKKIWETKTLTNGGPFHQQLEQALCDYLGVKHLALFANGTLALITALQSLRISGEIVTTPYSFVATSHALMWNGIKPVFVDIEPRTLNIDPARIESAITSRTAAIMPVHCYGHPCDVAAIQRVAAKHNLKIIYDAAHAFGVEDAHGSVLRHGDLSVLSFHATKVFNTFEGGAIVCPDAESKLRIDQLKNFGFIDEVTIQQPGINGKMSEVSAAFGLVQLAHIDEALARRREIDAVYRAQLSNVEGIHCLNNANERKANCAYFPILVNSDYPLSRDALCLLLKDHGIHVRRYFYPLISDFPVYSKLPSSQHLNLPVAVDAAARVICLPIYPGLAPEQQQRIIDIIGDT